MAHLPELPDIAEAVGLSLAQLTNSMPDVLVEQIENQPGYFSVYITSGNDSGRLAVWDSTSGSFVMNMW